MTPNEVEVTDKDNMEEAISRLLSVLEIEGVNNCDRKKAQREFLESWVEDYISELEVERSVITNNMSSEEEDYLKYYLGFQIAEYLIDDCATVSREKNKIKVKVLALSKKFPKNRR